MGRYLLIGSLLFGGMSLACAAPEGATSDAGTGPFVAPDLPVLAGQAATCAGPREKSFSLEARETTVDLGMGVRFNAWTSR